MLLDLETAPNSFSWSFRRGKLPITHGKMQPSNAKRRGEGISVHTNGCPGGGKGGGTGEKPEYMKDSDVKLAEKLLINNSSKVTYSWRGWVIVETECWVVRKGLFTSQSAVWDWAKVTIIVSSGCSHLKHSSHFSSAFPLFVGLFWHLGFPQFLQILRRSVVAYPQQGLCP